MSRFIEPAEEWEDARREANADAMPGPPPDLAPLADRIGAVAANLRGRREGTPARRTEDADEHDAIVDELWRATTLEHVAKPREYPPGDHRRGPISA